MSLLDPAPAWRSFAELAATASTCTKCPLAEHRTQVVFGVGDEHADLVFVGEGPGAEEDRQGIPFVGRAGQLLTRLIEGIGLSRDDVYICNVAKFPRVTTTRGARKSSCASRYGRHASISVGSGSRFPGGRHFTTLQM